MTIRIAINGLGRIGRCVLRALYEQSAWADIELVAVNGPAPLATHIHLLKYDSVHGRFIKEVKAAGEDLSVAGNTIKMFHERDPAKLPWGELGIDVLLECTGRFKSREDAGLHLQQGAKKVLISAPSPDADSTIVYGVNNEVLQADHNVISVGSCTTNCLAPVAKVLHEAVGIESGFMTTVHAYTGDQNLVDGTHKDMRRARAAALSMIPTSTGAAKALGIVLPELAGRLDGTAIRVPVANVSLVDFTFKAAKATTTEEIHSAIDAAATGAMKGVLGVCDEPLVSVDFVHDQHSSIFDKSGTKIVDDDLVRVAAWYDNEWGFSCRMLDVAALAGKM